MASNPNKGGKGPGPSQGPSQPNKNQPPAKSPSTFTSPKAGHPNKPPPPPPPSHPFSSPQHPHPHPHPHPHSSNRAMKNPQTKQEKTASLFTSIFGRIMVAQKWQQAMTEDRQAKIVEMFTIPRNDPNDVYKVNAEIEVQSLAETPFSQPLSQERIEMLHEIAINYDSGTQLDIIEAYRPATFISHESRVQLGRLPTWLRYLVIFRYDMIHAKFGHHTHHFIKMLANYVETRRTITGTGLDRQGRDYIPDEDILDYEEIISQYLLLEEEIAAPKRPTWEGKVFGKGANVGVTQSLQSLQGLTDELVKRQLILRNAESMANLRQGGKEMEGGMSLIEQLRAKNELAKVRGAAFKWRLPATLEHDWAPNNIHKAATTLRRALLTQPTQSETTMVAEDEKLAKNEKGLTTVSEVLDEEEKEEGARVGQDRFKKPAWEDIVSRKIGFKEEIAAEVEKDLQKIPDGLSAQDLAEEERLAALVAKKNHKRIKKKPDCMDSLRNVELFKHRRELKKKEKELEERGPFRRYSNIWFKNCPVREPVKQAKRFPHHYRCDESFHAYVVALVGSTFFKCFIMLAIVCNAFSLAAETSVSRHDHPKVLFDILDNLFLSIYLVEFILKIYAHPYRYWRSGFNIFDFVILVLSIFQAILTWSDWGDYTPKLKLLVIFRALRILRGISMSVQIQVLITALVETLKTHVLSVLLLLFLLMYITAIFAYYFFAPNVKLYNPWGNIMKGMLRLFSFVTLDGWTDTSTEFEKAGYIHSGRIFCLVGVLLGNFLISNIFIAIIIMQISEATDAYRTRERDEREEIISLKKEVVFRRQKLDMRQLLAKQHVSSNADFYYLGSQFLKLLRHDDLVEMNNAQFSPLWIDAFYKAVMRCHHTANVLMNLHRQMADNLLDMHRKNNESRYVVTPIRRSRYNRYMKLKAKLALIREEFSHDVPKSEMVNRIGTGQLRVNIGKSEGGSKPVGASNTGLSSQPGWK